MSRSKPPKRRPSAAAGRPPRGAGAAGLAAPVAGIAGGAALVAWAGLVDRAFGISPGVDVTLAIVAVAGFAIGATRRSRRRPGKEGGRVAAAILVALGAVTAALPFGAGGAAALLAALGAGADAGALVTTPVRALVGGAVLFPLGYGGGIAVARILRSLPAGRAGTVAAALGAAGAALGAALAYGFLIGSTETLRTLAAWTGVGLGLAGVVALATVRAPIASDHEPDSRPGPDASSLAGLATAFLLTAASFLAWRALGTVFGPDLQGIPIASALFAAGVAAGALLVAVPGVIFRSAAGPVGASAAAILGAGAALVTVRFPRLPSRFVEIRESATALSDLVRGGIGLGAELALPAAVLAGAALGLLVAGLPTDPSARGAWFRRTAVGAALGVGLGVALPRLALPSVDLGALTRIVAGTGAVLGAIAILRVTPRRAARTAVTVIAALAVVAAGIGLPAPDREPLLVDLGLLSSASPVTKVQKSWPALDLDGPLDTRTVRKRGHQRRLFVDGRFEMGDEAGIKSQGLLGHLPLLVHPDPRRVLLVGSGNAYAARAVLSHPVETLDCFVTSEVELRATESFGRRARETFEVDRLRVHEGDPRDLIARAAPYDAILDQIAGSWDARASRTASREFLRLVSDRLGEDGVYCRWVGGETLTKTGFQVLLTTVASVFPRVEVWAGQGSDTLILAKKSDAPHDFERLLEAYRDPRISDGARAAWIADPLTLLSQHLIGDRKVRGISASAPIHTLDDPHLDREETGRRLLRNPVDPVPGLVEIRDDVLAAFSGATAAGLPAAVRNAVTARDLEREALDLQLADRVFDAADRYEQGLELNPADGALRRGLASLRSRMGIRFSNGNAFTAAHSYMREAVEVDSTYAEGFANLGQLLMLNDSFDYAVSVTEEALALEPEDDRFHLLAGRIWKRRGYYDKAIPWLEKAIELNPRSVDAALQLVDCRLSIESEHADLAAGADFLESFLRYEPDNEGLRFRVGRLRDALADRIVREEGAEAAHTTTMQELFEDDDETAAEGGPAEGTGPLPDSASAPESADLPDED